MKLKNKTVIITGGSGGIGSEIARKFAYQGYSTVINYCRTGETAAKLQNELNSQFGGESSIAIQADMSKRKAVRELFDKTESLYGIPDVLINCAGINKDKPFLDLSEDEWNSVVSTILTGTLNCSQEFSLRYYGSTGNIINIGALTAIRGRKNGANYCSARAGVLVLTKCMALELAPNIRVNCVTPGWINTDEVLTRYKLNEDINYNDALKTIPLGRLGTPADIADLIFFLVGESSYYRTKLFG